VQLEELSNLCKQQTTVNEKFSLMVQRALHSMTSKEEEAKSEKE
jgi:hypothetical protein